MSDSKGVFWLKIANTMAFLFMITVNVYVNIKSIIGENTKEISNLYYNLFTPAGYTFYIWILIYLLLLGFVVNQLGKNYDNNRDGPDATINEIGLYFIISSLANAAWLFAWHNYMITLSVIFMLIILICMTAIASILSKIDLSPAERVFIKLPFSIYFGWITVAAIANITALLVSYGWSGFGLPPQVWTVIILILGLLIGVIISLKYKDIAYSLTFVWAYIGILVRHTTENNLAGKYPSVIITAAICIVILLLTVMYIFRERGNSNSYKR